MTLVAKYLVSDPGTGRMQTLVASGDDKLRVYAEIARGLAALARRWGVPPRRLQYSAVFLEEGEG